MERPELTTEEFDRFRSLIYRTAGISVPSTKRILITNRLRRRLEATGISKFADYYQYLHTPQGMTELPKFIEAITTNETYFFRDPTHYQWLGEEFLPAVALAGRLGKRPRELSIWSAACSTGEEPYSIAIKILDQERDFAGWKRTILGTDVNSRVLELARLGRYDARSLRLVPPVDRKRYFQATEGSTDLQIRPELQSMVTWKPHNLMHALDAGPFDVIFLKNVLIYFDTESKRAVVRNILRVLKPGGYLVAGPTEGVGPLLTEISRIKPWLFQKPGPSQVAAN